MCGSPPRGERTSRGRTEPPPGRDAPPSVVYIRHAPPNLPPSPSSALRRVEAHLRQVRAAAAFPLSDEMLAARDVERGPSDKDASLALPRTREEREKARRAGWVPPIDLIALNDSSHTQRRYMFLFREYKRLSSWFQNVLVVKSISRDVGHFKSQLGKKLCTLIMNSNFEMWLPPFAGPRDGPGAAVYPASSLVHRFYALVWYMLDACCGGRQVIGVLSAALDDMLRMSSDQDQLEHLIGLNVAILDKETKIKDLLGKGAPSAIKGVFGGLAKAWKKLLDPDYDRRRVDASDELWEFAEGTCFMVQTLLLTAKKAKGREAPEYNFNYRRIPRPKRTKEGQRREREEALNGQTIKKKRKASPTDDLIHRILAVEGVELAAPVYDSCDTVRAQIRAFLARDGATKASLCRALGGINHNTLNKFLRARGWQAQKGNETYTKAYCFFEKSRKLEGTPKSAERERNEMTMPGGFDVAKDPEGSPCYYVFGL